MVVITCADVVGGLFDRPILGSEEVVGLMGTLLLAFSLPVTHLEKGHIGVDLLYRFFPDRMKKTVDVVVSLISATFFGLVSWQSYLYAEEMKKVGEVSATIQFPIQYILYGVSLGCLVLALVIIVEFVSLLRGQEDE